MSFPHAYHRRMIEAFLDALESDLLSTRRGPMGTVDALAVWAALGYLARSLQDAGFELDEDTAELIARHRVQHRALEHGAGDDDFPAHRETVHESAVGRGRRRSRA